jgi:hypothetical protein
LKINSSRRRKSFSSTDLINDLNNNSEKTYLGKVI